jgi:hypothetical protein
MARALISRCSWPVAPPSANYVSGSVRWHAALDDAAFDIWTMTFQVVESSLAEERCILARHSRWCYYRRAVLTCLLCAGAKAAAPSSRSSMSALARLPWLVASPMISLNGFTMRAPVGSDSPWWAHACYDSAPGLQGRRRYINTI